MWFRMLKSGFGDGGRSGYGDYIGRMGRMIYGIIKYWSLIILYWLIVGSC